MGTDHQRETELANLRARHRSDVDNLTGNVPSLRQLIEAAVSSAIALGRAESALSTSQAIPNNAPPDEVWRRCQNPECRSYSVRILKDLPANRVKLQCNRCSAKRDTDDFPGRVRLPRNRSARLSPNHCDLPSPLDTWIMMTWKRNRLPSSTPKLTKV